jgi:hypothetical protein
MAFDLPWGGGYTSWGYAAKSSTTEGLTGVVYMPNRGYCGAARTNDIYKLTTRAQWTGSVMGPCQPLSITRGGGANPYWAFALDSLPGGFGFAFTTEEACETIRQEFNGYSTPLGSACALVSLTLLDAPVE